MSKKNPTPLEDDEQAAVITACETLSRFYPELELLYHIPNGGSRNQIEAAKLKRLGVRAGVPDLCLPVARGKYHGLYIEMKRQEGGRLSEHQKQWIERLRRQGYAAIRCDGHQQAVNALLNYMKLEVPEK